MKEIKDSQKVFIPNIQKITEVESILKKGIVELKFFGFAIFVITVTVGSLLYLDIKSSTPNHIETINTAKFPTHSTAFLIFRSSALASIAALFLYIGVKTSISCFDQAYRFTKRQIGASFLLFLYRNHGDEIKKEKITISDLMGAFEIWNKTVESAFSTHTKETSDDKLKTNSTINLNLGDKASTP